MKAKVLYSIEQEQFVTIHRVYLESSFELAQKDFEMLKDMATTSDVYLEDVDLFTEPINKV